MDNDRVRLLRREGEAEADGSAIVPVFILASLLGLGIGVLGWQNREEAAGAVALGAGSSMTGAALVLLVNSLVTG